MCNWSMSLFPVRYLTSTYRKEDEFFNNLRRNCPDFVVLDRPSRGGSGPDFELVSQAYNEMKCCRDQGRCLSTFFFTKSNRKASIGQLSDFRLLSLWNLPEASESRRSFSVETVEAQDCMITDIVQVAWQTPGLEISVLAFQKLESRWPQPYVYEGLYWKYPVPACMFTSMISLNSSGTTILPSKGTLLEISFGTCKNPLQQMRTN